MGRRVLLVGGIVSSLLWPLASEVLGRTTDSPEAY
ncbi:hypothetical protein SRABI83_00222 [Arthrobacter sp. Bi83]|jgi:hypothetical protein|nr:hypothetical protein SRABI83_00222 [Arthrobacter sp. Bi83]